MYDRRMAIAVLAIAGVGMTTIPGCEGESEDAPLAANATSLDERQESLLLEAELNSRVNAWLREMDLYIERRSSDYDEELIALMNGLFASPFSYAVYDAEGNELFPEAGDYTVQEWVEGQAIDTAGAVDGTMLAPPYPHVLRVVEKDKKVVLEGYHDHIWTGMFAAAFRTTRETGFDEFVFEKIDGEWLVTSYTETVHEVSPCSSAGVPEPCAKPPPSPAKGHPPFLPGLAMPPMP